MILVTALACIEPNTVQPPEDVSSVTPSDLPGEQNPDFWETHGMFLGGIRLSFVPEGNWDMGLQPEDENYDSSHTPHHVTLAQDYWVSETEVTVEQWLLYMDYHPTEIWFGDTIAAEELDQCLDCPAHSISWDEMLAFSNAVSEYHGLEPCFTCMGEGTDVICSIPQDPYTCEGYRPPTEAEWEWAAIGGESYLFPGSDDIDAIGFWEQNSDMVAHPVCSKERNGYDLCDMGGNIREFVLDWVSPYTAAAVTNPFTYPEDGLYAGERGGSWACRRPELRVNRRNLVWGYTRDIHSGFRLARTVHPSE